jgi:hypothetical protein
MNNETTQRVVVTDIKMSFWSMVVFMVKWTIAAIPALVILFVLGVIFVAVSGGLLHGLAGIGGR